jgi:hypothetical protein
MATDVSYFFKGSNIGPNGVLKDAIDVPEYLYLLSKKFFGFVNTVPDLIYYSEDTPSFQFETPNGFPFLQQKKLYSQIVPYSNPMVDTNTYALKPNSLIYDPSFSNYNYFYFNTFMNNDSMSKKYISKEYPYIAFYSNLLLTGIDTVSRYSKTLYSNFNTAYVHPLLQNAISKNYDGSYDYRLNYSNGTRQILQNNGYWLVDTDAGSVNFYDSNSFVAGVNYQVNSNNPPRISFFRYEGLFGEASILQGQDF